MPDDYVKVYFPETHVGVDSLFHIVQGDRIERLHIWFHEAHLGNETFRSTQPTMLLKR